MSRSILGGMVASLALAFAAVLPAYALEGRASPQPYVILVGVSQYQDKQILPRPHAEDDAKALYDVFTDKERLGVDPEHVRLLLGSADSKRNSEPATHDHILKALHWAAANARANDLVVFAFFGQGAPLGQRTCYLGSDSTLKDRAKNAVAAADVEHELQALKSHRVCIFLDVNFKGYDTGKAPAPELTVENLYKEFLGKDKDQAVTGRVLFLANNGLKPSLELERHGLFAKVLLDGLKGAADKEGYAPDGLITVDELVSYLDKHLPELVRKYGKTKEEKEQPHIVLEGQASHFVLVQNPKAMPKVKERLEKFEKIAADKELGREITDEGRDLLGRMPKLEAFRNLRKDYEKLADGELSVEDFKADRAKILAGMKMKRSEARAYAAKIMQAIQIIRDDYVKSLNQGELVAWGMRGLYQRLDEKIPPDIKERLDNAKEMSDTDLAALVADVRQRLGAREDLANHKDVDFALQRMLGHLDPHTSYIDPESVRQFKQTTDARFTGIGIQIRKDAARDMLLVVSPIKGSPAYKAGVQAGDVITTIVRDMDSEGKRLDEPEVISTKGLALNDAVKKILGKPGTQVKLRVEREGVDKPLEFEITRGTVEVETVLGAKRQKDDSWDYWIDPENKIAYIRLTQFARNSARDMARVVQKLHDQGVKGLVLDLRFNPGGLLPSAVAISDLFIDDGLIVTIRPRVGKEQAYTGEHEGSFLDFPMVCLVNGQSASASEIVSACLQDQHRAVVMGERSYGKGSVQNIMPFDQVAELRLTIASFWRPNGKNLNKTSTQGREEDTWGVTPDKGYLLKLSPKEREDLFEHQREQEVIHRHDQPTTKNGKPAFKDRQLDMALDYLRGQIRTAAEIQPKKAG